MNFQDEKKRFLIYSYPSFLLLFGLILFYSQMAFHWWSENSFSALLLKGMAASALVLGLVFTVRESWRALGVTRIFFKTEGVSGRLSSTVVGLLWLVFIFTLYLALKPAHTFVEGDFLEYHFYIPHQSWLWNGWRPIDWHPMEFFSLVIDYGYSFMWVSLPLLNRLPQFFALVFLLLKLGSIFKILDFNRPVSSGIFTVLAFIAFRAVIIQFGTAMMDLTNLYFLVSLAFTLACLQALESRGLTLLKKERLLVSVLTGADLAAYFGHKSFGPGLFLIIFIEVEILLRLFLKQSLFTSLRKLNLGLVMLTLGGLWLPNIIRSFYYTGDPFYPVLSQWLTGHGRDATYLVRRLSDNYVGAKWHYLASHEWYGYGHGLRGLVKSFFLAPLPSLPLARRGFFFGNNRVDYPLGIFWFSACGLLFWDFFKSFRQKTRHRQIILFFFFLSAGLYLLWFFLGQQGRWLYPTMVSLALYWGYRLAQTTQKRANLFLASILLMAVTVNVLKVPGSQIKSIFCFGARCLAAQPQLLEDYSTRCDGRVYKFAGRDHLGYHPCPAQLSRSDFPWVQNPP